MKFFFISLLFCGQLLAESSVFFHLADTDSTAGYDHIQVRGGRTAGGLVDLISVKQTVETAAATVYMPIISTATTTVANYNQLMGDTPLEGTGAYLEIKVLVTNSSGQITDLWAAYKDTDGTYKAFQDFGKSISSPQTRTSYTLNMTIDDGATCLNGNTSCLDGQPDETYELYIFQVDTSDSGAYYDDKTIDPGSAIYGEGATISLVLGEPTFNITTDDLTLVAIAKGDERLYVIFTGDYIKDNYYYKTLVADNGGGTNTYSVAQGTANFFREFTTGESGTLTVGSLVNDQTYDLSLAIMDKFQFVTLFSNEVSGIPKNIDAFLEEEGCFLLSAGFGRTHYVIDYFKKIRDQVLSKSALGRKFIAFYYRTAPKYTALIYSHPSISAVVRTLSYVLYFIFEYWLMLIIFGLFVMINLLFIFKRGRCAC